MISIIRKNPDLDITRLIKQGSFFKEENLTYDVDTCKFTISKFGSKTYIPAVDEEIEVYDGATKIFGGYISKITKKKDGMKMNVDCSLVDYTKDLDRKLVATSYTNQTPEQIIAAIVSAYTDGTITTNNVAVTGVTVEFILFDFVYPSKALTELAELIGYDWYLDYDKDLHFFNKADGEPAPWQITDSSGYAIDDTLEISEDSRQIRNTIYVRGGEYIADSRTDKIGTGDGATVSFVVPYKYDSEPTVTVGGVSKTVGEGYDTQGSYDCLWNYNDKTLKFAVAPGVGQAIVVTGSPLVRVITKSSDPASKRQHQTYEYRIVDLTIKTKEAARRRAQAEMMAYADSIEEGKFDTYASGLKAGMKITINSTILNENNEFIITKISTSLVDQGTKFRYSISMVTQRTMGIITFLQKQISETDKKVGVIKQESEVMDVIIDISGLDFVTVAETFIRDKYKRSFSETITSSDQAKKYIDNPDTWVAGEYNPTSIDDRKRVPKADRDCYLAT